MEFKHIFKPLKIGKHTAKNRIAVSPAEPFLCTKDGFVTPEFIAFTGAFARGGAGIVTVGDSPVTREYAQNNHFVVNLAEPFIVHGLVYVAEAIHRYGALASIELNLRDERLPADYTKSEIRGIIRNFAEAAERCRKAGFDMVMLHGGHGHSVAQFYSPFMNKRGDEYGAKTFANRCRFASELLDAVREAVGDETALDYRISGDELTAGGVGVEESIAFAKEMQSKLDMIHVSAGNMYDVSTISYIIQPTYMPHATNVRFAEAFKRELDIPITTVGSFTMELAEEAVAEGKADVVAMIRQFIADPDCVNKARRGEAENIRPCLRCNICTGDDPHGCPKPLTCSVNAVAGRETVYRVSEKPDRQKSIVIAGGGAAGLEAARRAAERGHSVVLFEREDRLGGALIAAGANELKGDTRRYAEWSVRTVLNNPAVDVRLNTPATRERVAAENPDVVVIAVGAEQITPRIDGVELPMVCFAKDIDTGDAAAGKRVVIIGAGLTGMETAVSLARRGHTVSLADALTLEELEKRNKGYSLLRKMAAEAGVKLYTGVAVKRITPEGVVIDDNNAETVLPCDTVALSVGVRPVRNMEAEFDGIGADIIYAGDCTGCVGTIGGAVRDGFYAAFNQ